MKKLVLRKLEASALGMGVVLTAIMILAFSGCASCTDENVIIGVTDTGQADMEDMAGMPDAPGPVVDMAPGPDASAEMGPVCPVANQCAEACCEQDELCIRGSCVVPGAACQHNVECPEDHICELTIQRCIPAPDFECLYIPDFEEFDPVIDHAWSGSDVEPSYDQVMMTPAVLDMTGDGIPEIIFSTFAGSNYNGPSILRAINGRTYEPVFDLVDEDKRVQGSSSVAVGDIDGDGKNEIVAVRPTVDGQPAGGLIAFDDVDTGWAVKWVTDRFPMNWDGAVLVDLDGNGAVEVVANNRVYDGATGELLCINEDLGQSPLQSITADLNGNGVHEIIAQRGAFHFIRDQDGNVECPTYWEYSHTAGFPAVGDFGTFTGADELFGVLDGLPEIAVVNTQDQNQVQLFNGQTGQRIWAATLPVEDHPFYTVEQCTRNNSGNVRNGGGPPTIADFDGSGVPEIATAGSCYYAIFAADGQLHWKDPTRDFSSRVTGSSVFDFQGDGKAEAVYADECFLRVYDGAGNGDGTTEVLFRLAHTTGTTRELPVIADVNGDFQANIVFASNDYASSLPNHCRAGWPDYDELGGPRTGISVVRDRFNRWVRTRPVWNQHAYHVTNVCDGIDDSLCGAPVNRAGAIPPPTTPNWQRPGFNNFRQNVQGEGIFDAPDLVVLSIEHRCEASQIVVVVTIGNQGARGVPAGIEVALWATGAGGVEQEIAVVETTEAILPGGRTTIEIPWQDDIGRRGEPAFEVRVAVDSDFEGARQLNECDPDNNAGTHTGICGCTRNEDCEINEFCIIDTGVCQRNPD